MIQKPSRLYKANSKNILLLLIGGFGKLSKRQTVVVKITP